MRFTQPRVLLLDGDYDNALAIARELSEDLEATIVGVGTSPHSRLLRSKYCDHGRVLPPPDDPLYSETLLEVIERDRPDVVLSVGYDSTAAVQSIRAAIPDAVAVCLPSRDAFRAAADKAETLRRGRRLGIETPDEYSDVVADLEADDRPDPSGTLPFPVFLKARWENGGATTTPVEEPTAFWDAYDRVAGLAPNDEVLVQEYVDGTGSTYGCGVLCFDGDVELTMTHEELRSVPRHGGSGTHLRLERDERVESAAKALLRDIGWHGVALAEFKRRRDGTVVLMEINPKFWASYALASRYGYRFASTIVADRLGLDVKRPIGNPETDGEMVFPLRELQFAATNPGLENVRESLSTLLTVGSGWDVDRSDLGAWLTPPAKLVRKLPRTVTTRTGSVAGRSSPPSAAQNSSTPPDSSEVTTCAPGSDDALGSVGSESTDDD
ncbi:carboxylate--amine ligase [Natrialbaceae archaeon A-gly3]